MQERASVPSVAPRPRRASPSASASPFRPAPPFPSTPPADSTTATMTQPRPSIFRCRRDQHPAARAASRSPSAGPSYRRHSSHSRAPPNSDDQPTRRHPPASSPVSRDCHDNFGSSSSSVIDDGEIASAYPPAAAFRSQPPPAPRRQIPCNRALPPLLNPRAEKREKFLKKKRRKEKDVSFSSLSLLLAIPCSFFPSDHFVWVWDLASDGRSYSPYMGNLLFCSAPRGRKKP